MTKVPRILCSRPWLGRLCTWPALVLLLAACGQRGPLYLPTEPAAAGRATLPEVLNPMRSQPAAPAEAPRGGTGTGTASPVRP